MGEVIVARLFVVASWCARHAPLRVSYALAAAGGWVAFYAWRRGRVNTVANFSHVFPGASPADVRAVARRSLANYGRYLVDFLRSPDRDRGRVLGTVDADEAFATARRGLERGRGVVAVSPHFGNWDLGAAAWAIHVGPAVAVAEDFRNPRLNRLVMASRETIGVRIVSMDRMGPSLVRALRRNEALGIVADRPVSGSGVRVPFFDAEVEVPAGPARLAMISGASIQPMVFRRLSPWSDRVRAVATDPFPAASTGDDEADVRSTTAAIFAAFEEFIRGAPDQWYMFRRMWPEGGDGC